MRISIASGQRWRNFTDGTVLLLIRRDRGTWDALRGGYQTPTVTEEELRRDFDLLVRGGVYPPERGKRSPGITSRAAASRGRRRVNREGETVK